MPFCAGGYRLAEACAEVLMAAVPAARLRTAARVKIMVFIVCLLVRAVRGLSCNGREIDLLFPRNNPACLQMNNL